MNTSLLTSHASAPGKVIVCGEYAVLQAQPAWVLAVDRRVHVRIEQNTGEAFEMHAEGLLLRPERADRLPCGRIQAESSSKLKMLVELFNALVKHYWQVQSFPAGGWSLKVDSTALFDADQKLGLGSSAAMTVALDEALKQLALAYQLDLKPESLEQRWLRLHLAHSAAQGKRGSGVDIAASLAGGVTRFCNHNDRACELSTVALPEGLLMAFIWSGQSASTPSYLRSLSHWRAQHSEAFEQFMFLLGEASSATLSAATSCVVANSTVANSTVMNSTAITSTAINSVVRNSVVKNSTATEDSPAANTLLLLEQFTQHLKAFDHASGLGIFASGHQELSELADEFEALVYKPCGAGGGDLGLAFALKPDWLNAFIAGIERAGHLAARPVNLNIDAEGVRAHVC